jgi:hypothetical protein
MREEVHNERGYLAGHGCFQAQAQIQQAFLGLSSRVWPFDVKVILDSLVSPPFALAIEMCGVD